MAAALTPQQLSETHRPTLDQALDTIGTRAYWSPHPDPRRTGRAAPRAVSERPRARPLSTRC
ncbi:hypothetical protein SMICM17S_06768 [Streptomyces microflavus]